MKKVNSDTYVNHYTTKKNDKVYEGVIDDLDILITLGNEKVKKEGNGSANLVKYIDMLKEVRDFYLDEYQNSALNDKKDLSNINNNFRDVFVKNVRVGIISGQYENITKAIENFKTGAVSENELVMLMMDTKLALFNEHNAALNMRKTAAEDTCADYATKYQNAVDSGDNNEIMLAEQRLNAKADQLDRIVDTISNNQTMEFELQAIADSISLYMEYEDEEIIKEVRRAVEIINFDSIFSSSEEMNLAIQKLRKIKENIAKRIEQINTRKGKDKVNVSNNNANKSVGLTSETAKRFAKQAAINKQNEEMKLFPTEDIDTDNKGTVDV